MHVLLLILVLAQPPLGYTLRGQVTRVVDGDTIELEVRTRVRVRLLDCWAPELNESGGPESQLNLRHMAAGQECVLYVPTKSAKTLGGVFSFDRVLGHVWRQGDEKSLNQLQVEQGFAKEKK